MKDNRVVEYLFPNRILKSENIDNVSSLLEEKDLQIGVDSRPVAVFNKGAYVILDFKQELMGGVRILTHFTGDPSKSYRIRVRFGESVSESCAELGEKGACNDHSPRDFYVSLSALGDQDFGSSGFRFVRIDYLGEEPLPIYAIAAKSVYRNLLEIEEYKFDDQLTQSIFDTCKRTLLLNIQNNIWDGIKRDRLVWIGDMEPEIHAILHLYGHIPEIDSSLDYAEKNNPLPGFMNHIPSYSIWYLLIIYDVYMFDHNREFLNKHLDYMNGVINQLDQAVEEDGSLDYLRVKGCPSDFYFIDWQSSKEPEEDKKNANKNLMKYVLQKVLRMYEEEGLDISLISQILTKLNKSSYYLENNKAFLAFNYLANKDEMAYHKLIKDGAKDMSTFLSYYVLKAVAQNDKDLALDMMKEYYGGMLSRGATTFWEDFNLEWLEGSGRIDELPKPGEKDLHGDFGDYCYKGFRHSLCHGWSSGPISFLIEEFKK